MKIFIFDISWPYCGGLAVACAETYERACELIHNREDGKDFTIRKHSDPKDKDDVDVINLIREVSTSETTEWTELNYQYA